MRQAAIPLLGLIMLFLSCPANSGLTKSFSNANPPPPVIPGYYPAYHYPLTPKHNLLNKTTLLRRDIEAHEPWLRQLVRQHYAVKSPLEFSFSYAGIDSLNRRLIIRYFAPNPNPDEIAGWQVQFVYRLPRLILECIYIWAVPLE
ncbi:MAG: hypothetical protein ACP5JB_00385 [candidate division WOR-3 bacterium]|jgi:hypothetical protein